MNAKVKYATFIDSLHIELDQLNDSALKAILRDDKGSICKELETVVDEFPAKLTWKGLEQLPYGVYTLELTHGQEEVKVRMVKRV